MADQKGENSCTDLLTQGERALLQSLPQEIKEVFEDLRAVVTRRKCLSKLERELILLSVNAAIHTYDEEAVDFHIKRALDAGASTKEIWAVLTVVGGQGTRTFTLPGEVLYARLQAAGAVANLTDDELALEREKIAWTEQLRGFPFLGWDHFLRLHPEFFTAYQKLMARTLPLLSARVAEFIIIASDVVTTNLSAKGAGLHITRALQVGATKEDILEIYELVAFVGWKSMFLGAKSLRRIEADR